MKCPGCGAALSSAMVEAGDCGYCGTALPKPGHADLARAIERLADQPPKVVHVTKVELRGPDVHVAGVFDSITARIAGCFTGCLSMGITLVVTAMILGFTGWQIWMQNKRLPDPTHTPPAGEHPKPGKRR